MFNVGEYIYDPNRLIFYKNNLSDEAIEKILHTISINDHYEELIGKLDEFDVDRTFLKERKIDLIGICLTYNCNLRCNYCSYSSEEGSLDLLNSNDILSFVVEAIKLRTIHNFAVKKGNHEPLRFFLQVVAN